MLLLLFLWIEFRFLYCIVFVMELFGVFFVWGRFFKLWSVGDVDLWCIEVCVSWGGGGWLGWCFVGCNEIWGCSVCFEVVGGGLVGCC